jgi:hypothetical protein
LRSAALLCALHALFHSSVTAAHCLSPLQPHRQLLRVCS